MPFLGRYGLALLLRAAILGMLVSIPLVWAGESLGLEETGLLSLAGALPLLLMLRRALFSLALYR